MYITRHMEKPVMELNEQYPVLLLTGPRQVGKTTMLEHLIEVEGKGRKKVSLDDLTLRELQDGPKDVLSAVSAAAAH